MSDERTLRDLALEALAVQDACNLSGVVHSWSRSISRLRELGVSNTIDINHHPINKLWASKVCHLTGMDMGSFSEAYLACQRMVEGE
jgi:hypothetical protein